MQWHPLILDVIHQENAEVKEINMKTQEQAFLSIIKFFIFIFRL